MSSALHRQVDHYGQTTKNDGLPHVTAAAVVSLALGIGANTAIFSLLHAVILRRLPVPNPQQLVQFACTLSLWETGAWIP